MAWIEYRDDGDVPDTDNILRIHGVSPRIQRAHYALKLTRTPDAMGAQDVETLREQGFGDRAIHDICAVVAYFAFVNRIANGLGVELEQT